MQNARDYARRSEKFLLIGPTGSGKTSQFMTIPGKKFMYIFDPNALNTIRGQDIDYEIFTPDILNMNVNTLKASLKDKHGTPDEPTNYIRWEKDFEDKIRSGFFDQYTALGFDSLTTFADIVMDRVQYLNGRLGKQPEQADWGAQMSTISNVIRTATSLSLIFFATAHEELKQDEFTKRVVSQVVLTGKLRIKLPLLFSEIYHTEAEPPSADSNGKTRYWLQTVTDKQRTLARCTLGLKPREDVTIGNWKHPEQYGLGKILKLVTKEDRALDTLEARYPEDKN